MSAKKIQASDKSSSASETQKKKKKKPADGTRETVESIAIAFILAFLFKTFQAEAYVIPTGSMAPTLYGRHKEVTCDGCGFKFALGASSEIDQMTGRLERRIEFAYCANCGKDNYVKNAPVFNGDRILVNKQVNQFRRFDVVVFKNPEQPHVNYIKRLVGLPGETVRVRRGDLWVLDQETNSWQIQRKENPFVQKAIQLTVYDDNYPPRPLIDMGWPERWEPSLENDGPDAVGGWQKTQNGWTADRTARTYRFEDATGNRQWLRYRHFQSNETTWPKDDQINPALPIPAAELISDFCSFNSNAENFSSMNFNYSGPVYWVSDLTLNATVKLDATSAGGEFVVELVEGPNTFQCVINLESGDVTLQVMESGVPESVEELAKASTAMKQSGSFDVAFANVDDRICLWINNSLIEFDQATEFVGSDVPQPSERDLAPAGIAIRNAVATVSDLMIQRDIYYRNDVITFDASDGVAVHPYGSSFGGPMNSSQEPEVPQSMQIATARSLTNPSAWAKMYAEHTAAQISSYGTYGDYQLDDNEYLMFGDNSSMSKDSRLFDYETRPMNGIHSHRYAVREKDLIGKALFIFWPHGIPFLNGGEGFPVWHHKEGFGPEDLDHEEYPSFRVPFYPNVTRMKKIR